MMKKKIKRNRGGALLVLGFSALVCLGIVAVHRLMSTSQTLLIAAREAGGAVAEQAAESIMEEALWNFQTKINDPRSDLFKKIRGALVSCDSGDIDLSDDCKPVLFPKAARESDGALVTMTLNYFKALLTVPPQMATGKGGLSAALPDRQTFYIECDVTVRVSGKPVRRKGRAVYYYTVSHISEPKPYDQIPLAIVHCGTLEIHLPTIGRWLDLIEEYNNIAAAYNQLREFLLSFPTGQFGTKRLEIAPFYLSVGSPPAQSDRERAAFQKMLDTDGWRQREWDRLTENGSIPVSDSYMWGYQRLLQLRSAGRFHLRIQKNLRFSLGEEAKPVKHNSLLRETPSPHSVIVGLERQVSLGEFDTNKKLSAKFWPLWLNLQRAAEKMKSLNKDFFDEDREAESKGEPTKPTRLRFFMHKMSELLKQMRQIFTDGIDEMNKFTRFTLGHGLAPFTAPSDRPAASYGCLAYHVNSKCTCDEIDDLVDRFGGVNGHVFLAPLDRNEKDSKEEQEPSAAGEEIPRLDLDAWHGKSVISSFAPLEIGDVHLKNKRDDLLILSLNRAVFSSGNIEAGICCNRAFFRGAPRIKGNFILATLPFIRRPDKAHSLCGEVDSDRRIFSGFFFDPEEREAKREWLIDDNYVVAINPKTWTRQIERGP